MTLVVAPADWRSACFSLPATRALTASTAVGVLCPPEQVPLWQATECEPVIPLGKSPAATAKQLPPVTRALVWEPGQGARACVRAGITTRIGPAVGRRSRHLTEQLDLSIAPGPPGHQVERYLQIAAMLGASPHESRWFEPLPGETVAGSLLISPDSEWGEAFHWPTECWLEVLTELAAELGELVPEPGQIHLAPGPVAARLATELDWPVADLAHPTEVGRYPTLIGVDGARPHIAAAYGTTCAVLFGPHDPGLVRLLGQRHLTIRRKVECSPCFATTCPLDLRCQHELSTEQVIGSLRSFLRRG